MTRFLFFIDSLSTWVGKAFAWLILVLTLGVSYEVFVRYALSAPTTWAFDFSYINYGALFLMAGAYTLSRNGHVRGDVIYRLWRPRTQATMDLVLYMIFFLPAVGPSSIPAGTTPGCRCSFGKSAFSARPACRYFRLKALIPVTGVFLLLQGIAEIIRCVLCIRLGAWPQRLHDVEETESVIIHEKAISCRARRSCRSHRRAQGDRSMTDPQIGMSMLFLFIFIIMLGFPIAFTLMAMGVGFGYYAYYTPGQDFFENRIFTLLVQKTFEVTSNDVLTAVPLFLFMGYVVERANILDRLFHSLQISMKNVPGALAVATLITCAMFATATGIVGAVVTLMGLLAFPAMLRAGYDVKLSAGVVCAGGCLGILIPPSILLIVYAATAGVSAVKLYAAAFLPGFLLTGLLHPLRDRARHDQSGAGPEAAEGADRHPVRPGPVGAADLVLPARDPDRLGARRHPVRLGDAVGSRRRRRARRPRPGGRLWRASLRSAEGIGVPDGARHRDGLLPVHRLVDVLLGVRAARRAAGCRAVLPGLNLSSTGFLVLTQVIIFLLGWPLEWTEIIIIFVPIFLPLLDDFKVDPIFFGILVALNTQTAFNTPPVAMAAFYLKGVAPPHVKLTDIFTGALPFVFMVFITMILVYIFPQIALWLPDYLYRPR